MIIKIKQFILVLWGVIILSNCGADDIASEPEADDTLVGFTTVPLSANKPVVRGGESVLGNMVADSFLQHAHSLGYDVDFAMANGGNIRFNATKRPDGIYPVGDLTRDDTQEILPFNNTGIVLEITGAELKSTFERSVHALPLAEGSSGNGAFAQLSSGIQIVVDTDQQPQVIDELNNVESIVTEGERVQQVSINGEQLDMNSTYLVLIPSFAASGGDGYVLLGAINNDRRTDLGIHLVIALEDYLKQYSPVTPIIENRILID